MNVCPVCRNVNQPDATVCRYCRGALTPPSAQAVDPTAGRRPRWPWVAGAAAALVLLLGLGSFVLFGAGGETAAAAGTPVAVGTGTGPSLEFAPVTVQAPANAPVELTFTNQADIPHNLSFSEPFNVRTTDLAKGGVETLSLPPAAPGTYTFVCTIHPGMEGQLTVQ